MTMHQQGYIGRKMRQPKLNEHPAIVIATFGTSSRGQAAMDRVKQYLARDFADYQIYWSYTSEIIRRKKRLPSLQETLAKVEADGYRKAVVQPLHIFPGTEYQQLMESSLYFPGLRIIVSETLCHRWDFVEEVLEIVAADFLSGEKELNLLALHGTPLAADPVNTVYLGMQHLVNGLYNNVMAATVEGVPHIGAVAKSIARQHAKVKYARIRLIPMMFVAGIHVEDDLMGEEDSWRNIFEEMGLEVDCPTVICGQEKYYKGLAFREGCIHLFAKRLKRALKMMAFY